MATKTESVRARMEPRLKQSAEKIFDKLGLSVTDAITLFYRQVALQKGLPFELKIPNDETLKAIADARAGKGLKRYASVDALFADIKQDALKPHA